MKNKLKLYHATSEEISSIDVYTGGLFDSALIFLDEPYSNTICNPILYSIEIDEDEILDVEEIANLRKKELTKILPIIKKVEEMTGLDRNEAIELLSEQTRLSKIYDDLDYYFKYVNDEDSCSSIYYN